MGGGGGFCALRKNCLPNDENFALSKSCSGRREEVVVVSVDGDGGRVVASDVLFLLTCAR